MTTDGSRGQRSYPAVRLALPDAFAVNNAEVADVVLHAALVQSFESGYLFLLHGHNELHTAKNTKINKKETTQ